MAAQFFECLEHWRGRGSRLGLAEASWHTPWAAEHLGIRRRFSVVRVSVR